MIYSMKTLTTSSLLFPLWLLIGFLIYVTYGYKKQRQAEKENLIAKGEAEAEAAAIETKSEKETV